MKEWSFPNKWRKEQKILRRSDTKKTNMRNEIYFKGVRKGRK